MQDPSLVSVRAPPAARSVALSCGSLRFAHLFGAAEAQKRSDTMSREDPKVDTWLSDAQLAKCARADADPFPSPIPTQIVSNGEWMPMPQTEEQKRVEARTKELADGAAKKLGISRRAFLAGAGGMAATFLAMNEVYGAPFFNVDRDEMFDD